MRQGRGNGRGKGGSRKGEGEEKRGGRRRGRGRGKGEECGKMGKGHDRPLKGNTNKEGGDFNMVTTHDEISYL